MYEENPNIGSDKDQCISDLRPSCNFMLPLNDRFRHGNPNSQRRSIIISCSCSFKSYLESLLSNLQHVSHQKFLSFRNLHAFSCPNLCYFFTSCSLWSIMKESIDADKTICRQWIFPSHRCLSGSANHKITALYCSRELFWMHVLGIYGIICDTNKLEYYSIKNGVCHSLRTR